MANVEGTAANAKQHVTTEKKQQGSRGGRWSGRGEGHARDMGGELALRSLENLLGPKFEMAAMADNVLSFLDAARAVLQGDRPVSPACDLDDPKGSHRPDEKGR
jgi:hypothetical protein